MLTLLCRVAEARPVVVVVEDLHWADASSRELFAFLARSLADGAVLLVGTVRTGEPAAGHPNRRISRSSAAAARWSASSSARWSRGMSPRC